MATLTHTAEALKQVRAEVGSWDGVVVEERHVGDEGDGSPDGLAHSLIVGFRLGNRSLGHIHGFDNGAAVAHLPFPRRIGEELIAAGRAEHHAAFSDSGWISAPLGDDGDVANAIDLLRRSYERALAQRRRLAA
jgi:hypothetical protein